MQIAKNNINTLPVMVFTQIYLMNNSLPFYHFDSFSLVCDKPGSGIENVLLESIES